MTSENSEVPEWFPEKLKSAVDLYKYIDGDEKLVADDPGYQHIADALNHIAHNDALDLSDEDFEFYTFMTQVFEDGDVDYSNINDIDMKAAWNSYCRIKEDFAYIAEQMFGEREIKEIVDKGLRKKPYNPPSNMGSFGIN